VRNLSESAARKERFLVAPAKPGLLGMTNQFLPPETTPPLKRRATAKPKSDYSRIIILYDAYKYYKFDAVARLR
jgi:hypothetical protein